jgi:hypothetical protein
LKDFKKKHGHCRVPQDFADDPVLGGWVTSQRTKKTTMPAEKRALLDGIGFDWDPHETKWISMYQRLESFKRKHGNCEISETVDKELNQWARKQRANQSKGGLREDREAKLNLLEFRWTKKQNEPLSEESARKWQENYDKLVAFKTVHGHCSVPWRHKEEPQLGWFVYDQRRFKRGLTDGQIALLDEIGFQWDPRNLRSSQSQDVTLSENAQLKSLPQDNRMVEEMKNGASDEEQQIVKKGAPINTIKANAEKSPRNKSGRDVWKLPSAPIPEPRIVNDRAINEGTLLLVTDGSETRTPQRTGNIAARDVVGELANKKEAEDSQAETTEGQESGNGDHLDAGGYFVPRHVYENDIAELERKCGKYKRKTLRHKETIRKLEREVKRLRVELHRAHLGSQLRAPGEVDVNTVTF